MAQSRHGNKGDFIVGPNGKRVYLKDLPLTAYTLVCSHMGREYGVKKNDLVFCPHCGEAKRVVRATM